MTIGEPNKAGRKGDDPSNIPLPFYANKANSIKKASTPEELTRWEKEVSELAGFQMKPDESSTISYDEPGHYPGDCDEEPRMNFGEGSSEYRPLPVVFGTTSSRYMPIKTPEALKQWENDMQELVGNIKSIRYGKEVFPELKSALGQGSLYIGIECVSFSGHPERPDDCELDWIEA
jgi:hypothetical protein